MAPQTDGPDPTSTARPARPRFGDFPRGRATGRWDGGHPSGHQAA